jgi:uridine kinase
MIKGCSGSGKTTLYKLLTSTYPKIINLVDKQVIVYFSPQHPLILPEAPTVL